MSRTWIWIAPDPAAFVSGGNRYNRLLTDALQQTGEAVEMLEPHLAVPTRDRVGAQFRIWDSLYWSVLREEERPGATGDFLLAHYLSEECLTGAAAWMNRLAGLIVPGPVMRDRLIAQGIFRDNILLLEPGIEMVPVADGPLHDGPLRMLTVANLVAEKGLLPFLETAFEALPDLHWTLLGDDRLDAQYAQRVKDFLADPLFAGRWRYAGRMHADRLWATYAEFDAFLSVSPFESYGMAAREALQAGLPVIGLQGGNLSALVRDSRQGVLYQHLEDLLHFLREGKPDAFRLRWSRPLSHALRPVGPGWDTQAILLRDWVQEKSA